MKIAFNPSTVAALITPPNNKDITFDLRGRNIFARGVKFQGTDTWRDIKINNVSIGSNILDLRNGSNTTLTNTNGVVTINSTWRPVVDNLTSDSTTSSLSANLGRVLAGLINGKSDSDHNHDSRYVKKSGDTMSGVLTIDTTNFGALTIKRNDDANGASIQFRGKSSVYGYIGLNNSTKDKQFLRWGSDTSKAYTILDTSSTYTSNGKGIINGTTITQVDNATNSTNSTNARKLVNWYSARPTSLNAQFGDGSLRIFYATSSTTEGKPAEDSHILHLAWDNNGGWDTQLAVHTRSGKVSTRAQNSGTWQPWKTLAFTTDIPSSLKNPYSFNVFGVTYDGSAAKTVITSNFISLVTEGTSTITDGTMFITSYASNNGFADTNDVNVPYKRKAIHLWEYVKAKTDSLYAIKSHNHDDRYVRAFGTSNDNIDSDWGLSFKTFDPIPSGTPPELNPNISLLSIGNNFNRRKLLAFIYSSDNIYYRRHVDGGFTNWRRLAFINEIPTSLKNPHALTISLNGTSLGPYDGSAAKNINITPGSIGAASSSHTHAYLPLSGGTMTGSITFSNSSHLLWNSSSYHLRIFLTDDFTADTAVFTFLQSSDSGVNWSNLMTIRDNGKVIANTFVGALLGNASTATNSDTLDGYHENSFLRYRGNTSTDLETTLWNLIGIKEYLGALPDNLTNVYNWGSVISLPGNGSRFEIYASHLSSSGNGLYYRSGWNSDKRTWLKFIDSSNIGSQTVASATKLQTSRTIWGQSFDGTANISGTLSGVAHIQFSADNTYNIGSNSVASKYIYTYWLGAKSGLKLELGANNSNFGLGLCIDTNLNVGIGTNTPAYKLHVNGTFRAANSTVSNLFVNTGDATLKIYTGITADTLNDGNICFLTSIDATDGQSHAHPTLYLNRCNIVLQPRGGLVYIGTNPGTGNTTYKLYVNSKIFSNGGFVKNGSSDSYVLLGGGGHKAESSLKVAYASSAGNTDTVDGYHASDFVKIKLFRFSQHNQGTWTKILTITINSTTNLLPVINFSWIPSECSRTIWADFSINWRNNSPIFYAIWKGMDSRTLKVVNSSGAIWDVWVSGNKTDWDPFGEIQVTYTHNITSYNGGSLGYSDTDPGGTICITGGQVNYANSAGSTTKVIVNLHTANDTNYPLVWSNLNNTNTVTENLLFKSWSDLYYNPKNKRLTVGGSIYAAHFYESSDKALKKNIKSILSSTNIPKIREFDWKDTEEHSYGFIALELEELGYSCLVSEVNGKKTVNYTATLALTVAKLLNLINIQNKKISNLTKELKALKYGRKKNS